MSDTLTLSLPADSLAMSQYAGFPFTGFFTLGGVVYGCSPDGLFALGGDDDDGEAIMPIIMGPKTDVGLDAFKRLRSAAVAGKNVDGATLSVKLDDGDWREADPQDGGRYMIGRDGAGRSMQFMIEGDGSDLEITSVTLNALVLGNRARG